MKKLQKEAEANEDEETPSSHRSVSTDDLIKIDPNKHRILKIINSLFFVMVLLKKDSNNIDLFSTNELERIIIYCNFDKRRTLDLIENKQKEDIFKLIEAADSLKIEHRSKSSQNVAEPEKRYKSVFQVSFKSLNLSLLDNDHVWHFLHKTQNIIDLQDILLTYDHHKLINKAKTNVKDRDSKKIVDYFEKYYKERERKYREIFKGNLEDNDLVFLETDEYIKEYKLPSKPISQQKSADFFKFPKLFELLTTGLKSHLLNFLDIQSVANFSMCNTELYNFVRKKYSYEKLAKFYCLMLFKNNIIYQNDEKALKIYRNYFEMYKLRPRIYFSGIYYSKIKFIKVGETYGSSGGTMNTVFNFRFYRFFPNGEIYSFTCPSYKPKKIFSLMQSNPTMMRKGHFRIDKDNTLTIEMSVGGTVYIYRYRFVTIPSHSKNLSYKGIELYECLMKNWSDTTKLEINEKFPKLFKFRSFNLLKNDIIITKKIVEE